MKIDIKDFIPSILIIILVPAVFFYSLYIPGDIAIKSEVPNKTYTQKCKCHCEERSNPAKNIKFLNQNSSNSLEASCCAGLPQSAQEFACNNLQNVVLVNYAAGGLVHFINQELLNLSARTNNINTIFSYNFLDLNNHFYNKNRHILDQKRGAGYWLWKPYIIIDAMKKTKENTIILYVDSDFTIRKNIKNAIDLARKHNRILFKNYHLNKSYVKRDTYILMNKNEEKFHNQDQLEASVIIIVNNKQNREFFEKMLKYCEDERILTDKKSVLGEELPEFKDHRHEQAILTLLAYDFKDQLILDHKDREKYILNHGRKSAFRSFVMLLSYLSAL
jgi:hypothetical protein